MTKNSWLMNKKSVCSGNRVKLKHLAGKIQAFVAKPGGTRVYSNLNRSTSNGQTPVWAHSSSKQLRLL
jgi:hypothetical protein